MPDFKSINQALRQTTSTHACLRDLDRIRNAMECKGLRFGIQETVSSTRIAVTGLTHTARIDDQAPLGQL
jgi:hypothetical protein